MCANLDCTFPFDAPQIEDYFIRDIDSTPLQKLLKKRKQPLTQNNNNEALDNKENSDGISKRQRRRVSKLGVNSSNSSKLKDGTRYSSSSSISSSNSVSRSASNSLRAVPGSDRSSCRSSASPQRNPQQQPSLSLNTTIITNGTNDTAATPSATPVSSWMDLASLGGDPFDTPMMAPNFIASSVTPATPNYQFDTSNLSLADILGTTNSIPSSATVAPPSSLPMSSRTVRENSHSNNAEEEEMMRQLFAKSSTLFGPGLSNDAMTTAESSSANTAEFDINRIDSSLLLSSLSETRPSTLSTVPTNVNDSTGTTTTTTTIRCSSKLFFIDGKKKEAKGNRQPNSSSDLTLNNKFNCLFVFGYFCAHRLMSG